MHSCFIEEILEASMGQKGTPLVSWETGLILRSPMESGSYFLLPKKQEECRPLSCHNLYLSSQYDVSTTAAALVNLQ